MTTFRNPVLAGFNPDPSVCRVGDDYYLVVSSFTYFPGIPVYHSRDLVNWEPIGHVIDRPGMLGLAGLENSDGVWAPTIRHHDGLFYVVFAVADGRRGAATYLATARKPAGPWSQLIPLDAEGIDPSLFFDRDGRCWFTACRDSANPTEDGPGELWMRELDLAALALTGPTHVLWHGALRGAWVEAPHLFEHDGTYHLLAAEGGTERNHSITAARATSVTGPYRTDPRSPLLTHRHLDPAHGIQNVGHADLVTTPAGETWAVLLAVRPIHGTHVLGRETFLVPVEWSEAGPVFSPGTGLVNMVEHLPIGTAAQFAHEDAPRIETFDGPSLPTGWVSLRGDVTASVQTGTGAGLVLTPSVEPLSSRATPAFVGRPQQHHRFLAASVVDFTAGSPAQRAGVTVFAHQDRFATLAVSIDERGKRIVVLESRTNNAGTDAMTSEITRADAGEGPLLLGVRGDDAAYTFLVQAGAGSASEGEWIPVGRIERGFFSTEEAGGFLGVHLGLFGTATDGGSAAPAVFRDFAYLPEADPEVGARAEIGPRAAVEVPVAVAVDAVRLTSRW